MFIELYLKLRVLCHLEGIIYFYSNGSTANSISAKVFNLKLIKNFFIAFIVFKKNDSVLKKKNIFPLKKREKCLLTQHRNI